MITLFDPGVTTTNIGDEIISSAVRAQLESVFKYEQFYKVSSHNYTSLRTFLKIRKSKYKFVGGSNLLSPNLFRYRQWKLNFRDVISFNDCLLVGVGWQQYSDFIEPLTSRIYKKVLSNNYLHSVRDEYTLSKLKSIGINNVINTACATMWNLDEKHCNSIQTKKARDVIFTLTDYAKDPKNDVYLINTLINNYKNVYFWIQGIKDYEYINTLGINLNNVIIVPPSLSAYDAILEADHSIDFIGTRLHAGIRALQKKVRTLIVGVDNRAIEKQKDFNIDVIKRENLVNDLEALIVKDRPTNINIPVENIKRFKEQFL